MESRQTSPAPAADRRRHPVLRVAGGAVGAIVLALLLLILLWRWDWFVPLINRKASAALHRPVSIAHLHVSPGLNTVVTLDDLDIKQPETFADEKEDFASAKQITVAVKLWRYITGHGLEIPRIVIDSPRGDIVARADGTANYIFGDSSASSGESRGATPVPRIDSLTITDGDIRVALAKFHADMRLLVHMLPPRNGPQSEDDGRIVVDAKGRYAGEPITGHLVGGALLSLANHTHPYPIDAHIENGRTHISLKGTVDDPLHFAGTKLTLHLTGPDMALLYPLTGVPIPHTPAYSIAGKLNYTADHIRFDDFEGRMGTSDIGGDIAVDPHDHPPTLDARLHSHRVDLTDLGGFIGASPRGEKTPPPTSPAGHVLPDQPIDVPKLNAINAHLVYHGDHIENRKAPLDDIDAEIVVKDGSIDMRKLNFAVGSGTLGMAATLDPAPHDQFTTKLRVDMSRLDIARLMRATGTFKGKGTLGGHVTLNATGNSVASLVANGNGGLTLVVDHGGDVSALLPDLAGLKLGSALLSAMGVPDRSKLLCFIANMPLRQGVLHTDTLLLLTDATRSTGAGTVNFRTNQMDYSITTRSVHMNILSIPGAIHVSGPINAPSITPGAEVIGRTAAAVGLGVLFPPAALIPTIQFGVGKGGVCEAALREADTRPAAGIAPGSTTGKGRPVVKAAPSPHHGAHHAPLKGTHPSSVDVHAAWERKLHGHP